MIREPIRLEPTEGERLPASPGERAAVGMAALALVAGLAIALGNVFGGDGETSTAVSTPAAEAAPDAKPSARPTRSPRPLREFWLQPGTPEAVTEPAPGTGAAYPFWGWIRPRVDLVIRHDPEPRAPEWGVLPAGELALAEEYPESIGDGGWLHVVGPQTQGWVATIDASGQLVERFTSPAVPLSGDVWGVAAGEEGFVAYGWSAGRSDQNLPPLIAASANGVSWEASDAPAAGLQDMSGVAWGPGGWLTVTTNYGLRRTTLWVWQSSDGLSWSSLGAMEDIPNGMYPAQLAASPEGYLLTTSGARGAGQSDLWFSADGVTWRETADAGLGSSAWVHSAGGAGGFYVWDQRPVDTQSRARAAFSVDGRTWSPVTYGPEGPSSQIVARGEGWLGVDADPATGFPRVWIGAVNEDQLTWRRDRDAHAVFEGGAVSALASDGRRAVAFGWDRSTEQPLVWAEDDGVWRRSTLPASFGGLPRFVAGGPAGFVAVGYRPTLRGSNPVFWHATDGGTWAPEPSPLLEVGPDPSVGECGSSPADAVEWAVLDRVTAIVCFGDQPLTVRAWSASCGGCYGPTTGNREPAWLAEPGLNQLYLSPVEGFDGWWTSVALDPSLAWDPTWVRTWVEVTGHFDDPASATCTWTPQPEEVQWYTGLQQVIDGCRQQFVVTAVTVVEEE